MIDHTSRRAQPSSAACTWPEGPCRCNPWWPALRDFSPTTVACETAVHPSSPSKAKDDGIAQEFGAVSTAQCEARGKQNPILMHGAERRCRLEHATVRVARGGKPCRFRPRPPVDPPPQPSLATCSRGAPSRGKPSLWACGYMSPTLGNTGYTSEKPHVRPRVN